MKSTRSVRVRDMQQGGNVRVCVCVCECVHGCVITHIVIMACELCDDVDRNSVRV